MKLELKHLAGYLPYGLKIDYMGEIITIDPILHEPRGIYRPFYYVQFVGIGGAKLILHPLSDLTKPIIHRGEEFVPLIRLLELSAGNAFHKIEHLRHNVKLKIVDCYSEKYDRGSEHIVQYKDGHKTTSFAYSEEFSRFAHRIDDIGKPLNTGYQLQMFQKLYEWHFDIHGLIDAGVAIDVNTLAKNPYA